MRPKMKTINVTRETYDAIMTAAQYAKTKTFFETNSYNGILVPLNVYMGLIPHIT